MGTHCEESPQFRNAYYIDTVFSPSLYTVINYSSTKILLYRTTWKSWGKCKEELLFGYWKLLKHCLWKTSKLSQKSFLSNLTFRNLQADLNCTLLLYLPVISSEHSWMIPLTCPLNLFLIQSTCLQIVRELSSKVI